MGRSECTVSRSKKGTSKANLLEHSTWIVKQEPIEEADASIDLYYNSVSSCQSPISSICSNDSSPPTVKPKRKRQCLDHLTQEEKTLRRKLKNRVAAQSARDRKKALFDQMKDRMAKLAQERLKLLTLTSVLKEENDRLVAENVALKNALCKTKTEVAKDVDGSVNSAAVINERQQRGQVPSAELMTLQVVSTLIVLMLTWIAKGGPTKLIPVMKNAKSFSTHSSTHTCQEKVHPPPQLPRIPPWWGCHQNAWSPAKVPLFHHLPCKA